MIAYSTNNESAQAMVGRGVLDRVQLRISKATADLRSVYEDPWWPEPGAKPWRDMTAADPDHPNLDEFLKDPDRLAVLDPTYLWATDISVPDHPKLHKFLIDCGVRR